MKRLTLEDFIQKSSVAHNQKYCYTLAVYKNNSTKVTIICPEHGEFLQRPACHMRGDGCPTCGNLNRAASNFSTFQTFLDSAQNLHGLKYDYSLVTYINAHKKVAIKCGKHGIFWQTPTGHLTGRGCMSCGGTALSSTAEFIKKAKKIHNRKFKYEKTIYIKARMKVDILCKKHGIFKQTPNDHLNGYGCPKCISSFGEEFIREQLLKRKVSFSEQYWIFDCRNINPLPFDFAIIKNESLFGLIEFQGKQHYEPASFGSKNKENIEKNFRELQKRDRIKVEYCQKRNIPLLIIPYWQQRNIPVLLKEFIASI